MSGPVTQRARPASYSDVLTRSQRLRPDGTPVWPLRDDDFGDPYARRLRGAVRPEPVQRPIASEFTGRRRWLSYAAVFVVCVVFWAAVFAEVFA